ncbi:hypothetical protein XENORESO_018276, partial [Xenotaenia resolanae]
YFWQTMKPDVVQWINNCSQCSLKIRKKPCRQAEAERSEMLQSLTSAECGSYRYFGHSCLFLKAGLKHSPGKPRQLYFYSICDSNAVPYR